MKAKNELPHFIHISRYARWNDDEQRRETWGETIDRYADFWMKKYPEHDQAISNFCTEIHTVKVMPSMRQLMTAGPALEKDHVAGYNCAFLAIDQIFKFAEVMYTLMCGTGVGFSVERQYVNYLPELPSHFYESNTTVKVADSKLGWAMAFREILSLLSVGQIPKWDISAVRPAGARLRTFGGRASGPGPLEELFRYAVRIFKQAEGRRLTSLECHDLVCKTGQVVVSGGVRRSALISLSNPSDERMRNAKVGEWYRPDQSPWRSLANNSAAYTERPDMEIFMQEWTSLLKSKSGERGIYNVAAAQKQAARNGRRDSSHHFGTNPCSEIILRDREFCNLTTTIVRADNTLDELKAKVRTATIIGTFQSTLTDFHFLSDTWKKNCEEERLLGVSLTGIMDHPVLNGRLKHTPDWFMSTDNGAHTLPDVLRELKQVAIDTNLEWSQKLGINQATAITCVKPEGTVSQLCDTASGIHARHAKYYIRRIQLDKKDPVFSLLKECEVPHEDLYTSPQHVAVFSFPQMAPKGAVTRSQVTALDQLNLWLTYQIHWCEHKPSQTIYIRDHEWMEVGAWVYKHFDLLSGISFLPYNEDDTVYTQAPYEEIDEAAYNEMSENFPMIHWDRLSIFETEDTTDMMNEMACTGDKCEVL
jgi:ribonucleoside-diphosphate reductase alpha chain